MGILRRQESSGQHLYEFDQNNILSSPLRALFEAEAARTEFVFECLQSTLETEVADQGVVAAAVFGSAARGEAGPESDLDLLVLVAEESGAEALTEKLEVAAEALKATLGLNLSPMTLTVGAARRQRAEGQPFILEAVRSSRRVAGASLSEVLDGPAD